MVTRKKPQADLERYRSVFLATGLLISLAIVITAFEWRFYDDLEVLKLNGDDNAALVMEEIDVPATIQPPPPKTFLEQPEIIEVKNEEEIVQDIEVNLDVEVSDYNVPRQSVIVDNGGAEAPPPPPLKIQDDEEEVFLLVEEAPAPEGGMDAFYQYVSQNLEYPRAARQMNVTGRVFIQFVVDKTGNLTEMQVVKGIGFGCDEEALRVLQKAPKWKPGKQRGRPVRVKMTIPIFFKIIE